MRSIAQASMATPSSTPDLSPEQVCDLPIGDLPARVNGPQNTATAGGVELVDAPGRPANDEPVRFADPKRDAAYWARIRRIVDAAPPLTWEQKAIIHTAFHGAAARDAA